MQCATCHAEMRLIPAGVSKSTGRPYQQFYSCPNRCPKPSVVQKKTDNFKEVIDYKNGKIGEAQDRKEQSIAIAGAKSGAGLIVAAMVQSGWITGDWETEFKKVADWIYNFTPEEKPPFD